MQPLLNIVYIKPLTNSLSRTVQNINNIDPITYGIVLDVSPDFKEKLSIGEKIGYQPNIETNLGNNIVAIKYENVILRKCK